MLDGRPLIDVHLHPARRDTLKLPWDVWVQDCDSAALQSLYAGDAVDPAAFDAMLAAEGVDVAVVLAEYSPKVTGTQAAEDMVALAAGAGPRVCGSRPTSTRTCTSRSRTRSPASSISARWR